jgi:hypothetical protein
LPSTAQSNIFGDLHLNWKRAPGSIVARLPQVALAPKNIASLVARRTEGGSPATAAPMNDTQRLAFATEMKKRTSVAAPPFRVSVATVKQMTGPPPPPPPPTVVVRLPVSKMLSPGAAEENEAARRALCAAYEGHVPNLPADFCQQTPH